MKEFFYSVLLAALLTGCGQSAEQAGDSEPDGFFMRIEVNNEDGGYTLSNHGEVVADVAYEECATERQDGSTLPLACVHHLPPLAEVTVEPWHVPGYIETIWTFPLHDGWDVYVVYESE
ncbi:MAG: hypothetical protein OEY44_03620 [Candidatus Peregrinibacteria bacterium]|nr:hypothetical protein [Candidatus Peregrinibacteria bacterium]